MMVAVLKVGIEIEERYVIQGYIESGGYGNVWRATDKQLQRDVALKRLLKDGISTTEDENVRLLTEARKNAKLVHTNIVQVYGVLEFEGEPFIVMEYVDGPSLNSRFRELAKSSELLPLDKAISILHDILSGVSFAHDKGIIHRDLSPSNILLSSTGIPKIGDFGIAREISVVGDDLASTPQGGTGNIKYMSPEQQRGEPADISSDLFMVGIIGYLLLTGRHPFAHYSGLYEIPELIKDDNFKPEMPKPPSFLTVSQQRLYREYASIVMRLLNREKAGRFVNARNAIQGIDSITPYQECPNCGEKQPEHNKFCGSCGTQMSVETSTQLTTMASEEPDLTADELVELGFQRSQLRKWEDAIILYNKAIQKDQSHQKAFRNLGFALNSVGRYEEAEKILSRGLEIKVELPSHKASMLHERAFSRSEVKEYEEALADINEALKLTPYAIKSVYLRARINLYKGDRLEAIKDAQSVLRAIPDHMGALRIIDQLSK
jgi:serine/threonine protein kinase